MPTAADANDEDTKTPKSAKKKLQRKLKKAKSKVKKLKKKVKQAKKAKKAKSAGPESANAGDIHSDARERVTERSPLEKAGTSDMPRVERPDTTPSAEAAALNSAVDAANSLAADR